MKLSSYFLTLLLSASPIIHAAMITNNISGMGPKDSLVSPYLCIQNANGVLTKALAPGESVDGNQASGNIYYVGATLRFGGCGDANTYLGYVGFSVSSNQYAFSAYSPPAGVHVTYARPAIDRNGVITGAIEFTPIKANFNVLSKQPSQNISWPFVGINLAGLEFSKIIDPMVIPNLSVEDATGKLSDLAETQAFVKAGMNTVRVPVRWGYLQLDGPGVGDINLDYFNNFVKPLLESLTSAHINTIVDLHAYMRYAEFGKGYAGCGPDGACPDGKLITDPAVYQDIWSKLYTLIKSDPKIDNNYILLDLMNEPVDVPNDSVFTIQTQLIKSLRQQGFQGYILVEGNAWSGLHSWLNSTWQSSDGKTSYTNGSLFTRQNFNKAGITDLSKIIINVHQYLDSDYSGTKNTCLTDLTTVGANGFNLNAFADYLQQNQLKAIVTEFGAGTDQASCSQAMSQFLNYLKDNAAVNGKEYGFIGWTIWSAGHGFGGYNLRVTPTSYQMQTLQRYLQAQ